MEHTDKELVIIGGANGSGKTTFAKPYVKSVNYQFLNADEIAKELEDKGESNVMIKAGRIFFGKLNGAISNDENIVVESTLSGTYINKISSKAKRKNYKIRIIYIFLDDPEMCIKRVGLRVIKGGHDVPEEDIVRRFYRSKNNFWDNLVQLSDSWILLYNGEQGFQPVAIGESKEINVSNKILFNKFKSISK